MIASVFILCNLYGNFIALNRSAHDMGNLERRTGTIREWNRTYGKYNTARLTIEGDTTIYFKKRVGGWFNNLQHSGKAGEKVVFYTIKKETLRSLARKEPHYFGLSEEINPRSGFWIFFDLLFYNIGKVLLFWYPGFLGSLWATQYVKNRAISIFAGALFVIAIVLFGLALCS